MDRVDDGQIGYGNTVVSQTPFLRTWLNLAAWKFEGAACTYLLVIAAKI